MKRHYDIFKISNKCITLDESTLKVLDKECSSEFKSKEYLIRYSEGITLESDSLDDILDETTREEGKIIRFTLRYFNDEENQVTLIFSNENYSSEKYPIFISMGGEVTEKERKLKICNAFDKLINNNVVWFSKVRILCDTFLTMLPLAPFCFVFEKVWGISLWSLGLTLAVFVLILGIKKLFYWKYNQLVNTLTPRVIFNIGLSKKHEEKNKFIRESIILAIILSVVASIVYEVITEFFI